MPLAFLDSRSIMVDMKQAAAFSLTVLGILALIYAGLYFLAAKSSVPAYTDDPQETGASTTPQFADHPAEGIYTGAPAQVDFTTEPSARTFRTRITDAAKDGPNFAGHYTVVTWGCGTSCQGNAVVDAESGAIVVYGIVSSYGLSYRLDSDLLIVNPKENLPLAAFQNADKYPDEHYPLGTIPTVSDYYIMGTSSLRFIGQFSVGSGKERFCLPVPSPARNPLTNKIQEFRSPCEIPFGWDALETGEGKM